MLKTCGQAAMRFVDNNGQPVADRYSTIDMVMTPGFLEDYSVARIMGALVADVDFISNLDRTNYPLLLQADKRGKLHLPALIPGATYRVRVSQGGRQRTAKTFQGKANETLDLGDIVVERTE